MPNYTDTYCIDPACEGSEIPTPVRHYPATWTEPAESDDYECHICHGRTAERGDGPDWENVVAPLLDALEDERELYHPRGFELDWRGMAAAVYREYRRQRTEHYNRSIGQTA